MSVGQCAIRIVGALWTRAKRTFRRSPASATWFLLTAPMVSAVLLLRGGGATRRLLSLSL